MSSRDTNFADALRCFYEAAGLLACFECDLAYLQRAYERTEELYRDNFEAMEAIRLVILAEAPLFGAGEVYIYSPEARHTNFLWPGDLAGIVGRNTSGMVKPEFLALLRQLGVLMVDIFPYALNNADTALVYKGKKGSPAVALTRTQKRALARAVMEFHVRPKLEQIAGKGGPAVRFCARYTDIGEIARALYPPLLAELGFAPSAFTAISMQGGMVDKEKLMSEYQASLEKG